MSFKSRIPRPPELVAPIEVDSKQIKEMAPPKKEIPAKTGSKQSSNLKQRIPSKVRSREHMERPILKKKVKGIPPPKQIPAEKKSFEVKQEIPLKQESKHSRERKKVEEEMETSSTMSVGDRCLKAFEGTKLFQAKIRLSQVEAQNEELRKRTEKQSAAIEKLERAYKKYSILQQKYADLKDVYYEVRDEIKDLRHKNKCCEERFSEILEENTALKRQLFQSEQERKKLHNTVIDLRGNIRVFCRVRPPLISERDRQLCDWRFLNETTLEIRNDKANKTEKFSFDHVFQPDDTQEFVFEMVSPLIQSALDGYNVCIFAYGQTGSGKTFTMDGISNDSGIIPRTVNLIFDSVQECERMGWQYQVKVMFLEIYNETLCDLLSKEQKECEIRMNKDNKSDVYVSNVTQETVESSQKLAQLIQIAKRNRATASTAGNARSSRSHAVTKITLTGTHEDSDMLIMGTINLVDLAGSESPKTSSRMNETKGINSSLSELKTVITALVNKNSHVPYRNSKLTHLLMPSLGGNSKTLMFINVAPFLECYAESVNSMRFAVTVNEHKVGTAKQNRWKASKVDTRKV